MDAQPSVIAVLAGYGITKNIVDNSYLVKTNQGGESIVSNFVLNVKYKIDSEEGQSWFVDLVSLDETKQCILDYTDFKSPDAFNLAVKKYGVFSFWGTKRDMEKIFIAEFRATGNKRIQLTEILGKIEEDKFLTNNKLFYYPETGTEVIDSDKDGIFWINELKGIKFKELTHNRDQNRIAFNGIKGVTKDEYQEIGLEFISKYHEFVGEPSIMLGMGWMFATLFSDEIYKEHSVFPLLFIGGITQSGKSFMANMLNTILGFNREGDGIESTSQAGMIRTISTYANLPYWLNEWRNDPLTENKWKQFFLGIFDRSSTRKARLNSQRETYDYDVRSTVMLTGENIPADPALRSRCIIIQLNPKLRTGQITAKDMLAMKKSLSQIGFYWLANKEKYANRIHEAIDKRMDFVRGVMGSNSITERFVTIYGIVLGCSDILFEDFLDVELSKDAIKEYDAWVKKFLLTETSEKTEGSVLGTFWDDFETLVIERTLTEENDYKIIEKDGLIAFRFSTIFSKIEKHLYRAGAKFKMDSRTTKKYLQDSNNLPERNIRLSGVQTFCVVADINQLPESLKGLLLDPDRNKFT